MKQLQNQFRSAVSRWSHAVRYQQDRVRHFVDRRRAAGADAPASALKRFSATAAGRCYVLAHRVGRLTPFRANWRDRTFAVLLPWWQTRRRRELLLGIPALLALVAIGSGALLVTGHRPTITRNTQLLRLAELSMAEHDFNSAAIAYQRLLQVGNTDPGIRFGLARCWAAMGDREQAVQTLTALAPDDAPGYVPAHRVRAFLLMESPNATAEQLAQAKRHLEIAVASDPDDAEAHGMLGRLLQRQGNMKGARDEYAKAGAGEPEMNLSASMLSQKLGDADLAVREAQRAEAYYRAAVKDHTGPTSEDPALGLAQALCVQKRYDEALAAIGDLIPASEGERRAKAITEICGTWQAELDAGGGLHDVERLRIAGTMLAVTPDAKVWQLRLLDLAQSAAVGPAAEKVLNGLADSGHAGAEVCFYLGMEAFSRDEIPAARKLLEKSLALEPGHAATLNNLACALLAGEDQDAARALAMADGAIKAEPGNANYHETRGESLLALSRWADAAAEFERAIPGLRERREARQHLAQAYQQLGQGDRAREQESLAASGQ